MYVYVCVYVYTYIYIYVLERERERERQILEHNQSTKRRGDRVGVDPMTEGSTSPRQANAAERIIAVSKRSRNCKRHQTKASVRAYAHACICSLTGCMGSQHAHWLDQEGLSCKDSDCTDWP